MLLAPCAAQKYPAEAATSETRLAALAFALDQAAPAARFRCTAEAAKRELAAVHDEAWRVPLSEARVRMRALTRVLLQAAGIQIRSVAAMLRAVAAVQAQAMRAPATAFRASTLASARVRRAILSSQCPKPVAKAMDVAASHEAAIFAPLRDVRATIAEI